jgi:hypothetical protein
MRKQNVVSLVLLAWLLTHAASSRAYADSLRLHPFVQQRPGELVRVNLGWEGKGAVSLAAYRLRDSGEVARAVRVFRSEGIAPPRGRKPFAQWQWQPPASSGNENVAAPKLPPGAYVVTARRGKQEASAMVNVTHLACTVKRSPTQLFVYTYNNGDTVPMPNVSFAFYDDAGRLALRGRTGRDAVYLGRMASNKQGYVIAQDNDSFAMCRNDYYGEEGDEREDYLAYLYTDRPIYRPGQTVMFKGIVRRQMSDENGISYQPLSHHDMTVQVRDSEDHLIARQPVKTNAMGTFSGSVMLSKEPAIGWYTLQVQLGGEKHRGYFWVAEYQKPDFFVEVSAPRGTRIGGDKAPVTIRARYYMGRPVAGATVELFAQYGGNGYDEERNNEDKDNPYGGEPWRPDWFEGIYDEYEYVRTEDETRLKLGDLQTDREGVCIVSIPTEVVTSRSRMRLVARVTDAARRSARGGTSLSLSPANYHLTVDTDRYWYAAGDAVHLNVATADLNEQPAVCRVAIEATAVAWSEKERQSLLSRTLTTDKNGRASLTLTAPNSPWLEVTAQVKDTNGRTMKVLHQIWISTRAPRRASRSNEKIVDVTADRSFYRPGENAKIALHSTGIGTTMLVCVEGPRIFDYRLVPLRNGAGTLNLPLPRRYAPNVTVHASASNIGGHYESSETLFIPPREKFLRVNVTADRANYRPGERARFTVDTKDQNGKPVSAEVSLGLVDEAIYAVREEESPDIRRYFYGAQHSKVVTFYSVEPDYTSAEAGGNGAEYEVRKEFPDTAYWNAHVVTDKTGKAVVDVELPDSLTSWRATARAVTADTKVGAAKQNVTVNLPFFARLAPPPFLAQGDEVSVPVAIHNDTPSPVSARASLTAQGATVITHETQTLSVPSGFPLQTQWRIAAPRPGAAQLTVKADAGNLRDGMQLTVPVLPVGFPVSASRSGEVAGSAREEFNLPAGLAQQTAQLRLTLAPNLFSNLLGVMDDLAHYPYG